MQQQMPVLETYDEAAVMEDQARHALDKRLYVNFYVRAVMNHFKSAEQGRPIYDEKEYCRIIIPGDKNSVFDQPATAEHRLRFEPQYARFQKGQEQAVSGTPLEVWPQMTVGQVAELKAMHVTTVEQLAEMSDETAQKFMGNHKLRAKAQAFLAAAAGDSQNTKMALELEKRDSEIAAMKMQMEQLMKAMSAANAKDAKGK